MSDTEVEQFVARLAKRHKGHVTPEQLVRAARDPNCVLHHYFEWDDDAAADKWRLEQARRIIRSCKVVIDVEEKQVKTVAYVRDPRLAPQDQGYVSVARVKTDEDWKREVLVAEFSRAGAALARAKNIAQALELYDEIGRLESDVVTLSNKVAAESMMVETVQ